MGSWRAALQRQAGADTMDPMTDTTPAQSCMTVLYDGDCPLCRREIAVYQGLAAREPVRWVDVSAPGTDLPDERSTLMARFHVQREDGSLLSGAEAFLALWARLPGWRWPLLPFWAERCSCRSICSCRVSAATATCANCWWVDGIARAANLAR